MPGRGFHSASRMRVPQALCIIFDDALRAVVVELLTEESYTVTDVASLEEARLALPSMAPSLIVIEPGIHNNSALRSLLDELALRASSAPPTIVLSDRESAACAAGDYSVVLLRHPFDLDDFVFQIVQARGGASRPSMPIIAKR